MLTDKILKGINKAWGAGEGDGEELVRLLVDKHGFSREEARQILDYAGPHFTYQGDVLDTADKLAELVGRMSLEFTPAEILRELDDAKMSEMRELVESLSQRTRESIFADAKRLGVDLRSVGFEFDEYDPDAHLVDSHSDAFRALRAAVVQGREREKLPAARQQWLEDWGVPESEREKWEGRPLTHPSEAEGRRHSGAAGWYNPRSKNVVSVPDPETIAHEMAHANYYENMPYQMHAAYPILHSLARWLDPAYKEATIYGKKSALGVDAGRLPIEGYATAYQHLGKQPEQMPWYMEPFYGKLGYSVPNIPVLDKLPWVHVGSWAAEKVQQWAKDKLKDKKKATAQPTGGAGGGGWSGGGDRHHELL